MQTTLPLRDHWYNLGSCFLLEEDKQNKAKSTGCRLESVSAILKIIFREKNNLSCEFLSSKLEFYILVIKSCRTWVGALFTILFPFSISVCLFFYRNFLMFLLGFMCRKVTQMLQMSYKLFRAKLCWCLGQNVIVLYSCSYLRNLFQFTYWFSSLNLQCPTKLSNTLVLAWCLMFCIKINSWIPVRNLSSWRVLQPCLLYWAILLGVLGSLSLPHIGGA